MLDCNEMFTLLHDYESWAVLSKMKTSYYRDDVFINVENIIDSTCEKQGSSKENWN